MTLRLRVASATHVGLVRDANEDAFHVDEPLGLVVVADGMGGHRGGEVASATALEALRDAVARGSDLASAIVGANQAVFDKARDDAALAGMGTTLTAGWLDDETLVVGHVGDSRAYLVRDGELTRVTQDHSLVAELVAAGEITEEEAETDPRRSMITRALGVDAEVEADMYPVDVRAGDRLLFCSDGLTGMVGDDRIAELLTQVRDPEQAVTGLVEAAIEAGGADNVTVVVADVLEADGDSVDPPAGVEEPPTTTRRERRRFLGLRRRSA